MIANLKLIPALALLGAGYLAVDAWRKRSHAHAARADISQDLKTWEGEGGNLPPGSSGSNTPEPETSLATAAP